MGGSTELDMAETILRQPGVLAAIVMGSLVLGTIGWLLAAWRGWAKGPAAVAGCGVALALGVTLVRSGFDVSREGLRHPLSACIQDSFSLAGDMQVLNFAMLMPVAFFGTLATKRPLATLLSCAVLSGGIELIQATTSVGVCQKQDFLNNSVGALLAVAVAWGLLALSGRTRSELDAR